VGCLGRKSCTAGRAASLGGDQTIKEEKMRIPLPRMESKKETQKERRGKSKSTKAHVR
jgi:hypothetical protein